MLADIRQRRQVLRAIVVVRRQRRSAAALAGVIAAHGAQGVPVIFHDGDADAPRHPQRLDDVLYLLVTARTPQDRIAEVVEHEIPNFQVESFGFLLEGANLLFFPRAPGRIG